MGETAPQSASGIVVVDLEATCWEGPPPPRQVSEVIEIGVCLLDRSSGAISHSRSLLVKPSRSQVSPFCTKLTTLTQDLLDREGTTFAEACRILREVYQGHHRPWASYGAYDFKMLQGQCQTWQVDFPLSRDHLNVKELVSARLGLRKKVGMAGALQLLGLPLQGTHHRGVDDAYNIARILHRLDQP